MRGRTFPGAGAVALIAVALAWAGCGEDFHLIDDRVDGGPADAVPAPPGGSFVGTVTDLFDGDALVGARVSTVVPSPTGAAMVTDTSDVRGAYRLPGIPEAGSYRLVFSATGYVDRFADVALPDTGTTPPDAVATLDMALAAADAALTGTISGYRDRPAGGATVALDLRGAGFDLVTQATAAADGTYALPRLPGAPAGFPLMVVVLPYDAEGDGVVDYSGGSLEATTWSGATTRLDVDLRLFAVPLTLQDSDLEEGTHPAAPPLAFRFNLPLDPEGVRATLTDLDLTLAVGASVSVQGASLAVTAAGGTPLAEGHRYEVTVEARAANGSTLAVTRRFQVLTGPITALPPVAGLTVTPAAADCGTRDFVLAFEAVPGALGYQVFARDDAGNPAFLLVATAGSAPAPHLAVTLPATFDVYSGDSLQTPFADHTRVDFAVVPVDVYGQAGDAAAATIVSRTDTVPPTVAAATSDRSADNQSGATAASVALDVTFSEYLDPAVSNLAIALPAVGMSAVFVHDPALLTGRFTISVPSMTDGRGAFAITGAVDTSGNAMLARAGSLP